MKKIAVILGTRPEAIKLAPVILALQAEKDLCCRICVTGQHRQMVDQALEVFNIQPDVDLNLMKTAQTLAQFTVSAIEGLDRYLSEDLPDLVLVQGDTTTVFCAALAAFYQRVLIGHVEAGLRSGNLQSPWPEEANRVLTTRLATLHFPPTEISKQNLLKEGVPEGRIWVTGNTGIDALFMARDRTEKSVPEIPGMPAGWLTELRAPLVVITGHRRENFGSGFEGICRAIALLADHFPGAEFVYPVHLNPMVREPVFSLVGVGRRPNVHLIGPISYLPFVALMSRARVLLTDSGGIQEEGPSLGVPVLVMRDTTERPEAIAAGTARLVGTDPARIFAEMTTLLTDPAAHAAMARAHNPYGDGKASGRIVGACLDFLRQAR